MYFVKGLANSILTYVPNMIHICSNNLPHWQFITKPQQKKWTYKRSHKSLNSYSLVEYNKIYPNTNSWKTLQEESLWQEDFDNLYFWKTLNKTHQGILVWSRNKRLYTINKKHVHKWKEITHVEINERTVITTLSHI